jgi:TfoX/Sxy family transcriptional regulator of competence genes
MAWIKIPAENHPIFLDAVPRDPRVATVRMFGGLAAMVNGHMLGGLFARSVVVRLSHEDQKAALALDGSEPFDPMGNGRVMKDTILLAEEVMNDREELRGWLQRALDFTASLPRKKVKPTVAEEPDEQPAAKKPAVKAAAAKKAAATKPAAKAAAAKKAAPKKAAVRKARATKPAARKAAATKPAAKKGAARKPAPKKAPSKKPARR